MAQEMNANDRKWQDQHDRLIRHLKANNGKIPYARPGKQDPETESIAQWVGKQRKLYRVDGIPEYRLKQLVQIPGLLVARRYRESNEQASVIPALEEARVELKSVIADIKGTTLTKDEATTIVDATIKELITARL